MKTFSRSINKLMVLIYIRHGHDSSSSRHKYDERLTERGKKEARRRARKLISEHGLPNFIYYSPLQRTRKTAKQFLKVATAKAKEMNQAPPQLMAEPRLGRYFTESQIKRVKRGETPLRSTTANVLFDRTRDEFKKRVGQLFHEQSATAGAGVVWNVTHSLVLLHVAAINKISRSSHVDYLEKLVVKARGGAGAG
jgi:broad specificity phosphatase PhoE